MSTFSQVLVRFTYVMSNATLVIYIELQWVALAFTTFLSCIVKLNPFGIYQVVSTAYCSAQDTLLWSHR